MQAVILVGGKGERLRPLTESCPKPLLRVGNKPLLQHILEYLCKYGFKEIILCIGYLGNQIKDYFKDGSKYGVKIIYSSEKMPLGTGGPIKKVEKYINRTFLAMNGDILTDLPLNKMVAFHKKNKCVGTIALAKMPSPYGVIHLNECEIRSFEEKPLLPYWINAGIYILEPEILNFFSNGASSIEHDVFPKIIKAKEKLCGFKAENIFWLDIGSFKDYKLANEIFRKSGFKRIKY